MSAVARAKIDLMNLRGELVQSQDWLEELTEDFAVSGDDVAHAEADYKRRYALAMIETARSGVKRSVADREAIATVDAGDALATFLVLKAKHDSVRQALFAARSRQDTLRTLSAGERVLLGSG